jgi:ubiquinone/menaquinone biosynthesis C-methylase UbiE
MTMPTGHDWRSFYTTEAAVYDASRYGGTYGRLFDRLHRETVAALLRPYVPGRALEVAAGTGHVSVLLSAMGFDLTALDLTAAMLVRARERLRSENLAASFTLGSAFALPFAEHTFDVVVSTRFLHLWPTADQQKLVAEKKRVLIPGGKLLVDFNNWWHHAVLSGPIRLYQLLWRRSAPQGEHYNRVRETVSLLESAGLRVAVARGVGGYHLVAPALLSPRLGFALGRLHRTPPLRALAEQLVVLSERT